MGAPSARAAALASLVQPKQKGSSVGTLVDAAMTDLLYGESGTDCLFDFNG